MSDTLADLFRHNLWSTLRLLDACEALDAAQLDAAAPGTYGTIRSTLQHLLGAERRYVARLRGQDAPPRLEDEAFPGFDTLRQHARRSGEALIEIATGWEDGTMLRGEWQGERYEMRGFIPLLQALHHATEHRTHITSILGQHGIEPPEISAWTYDDETLER